MISIVQHGVRSADLLARRLASMRGRLDADVLENLALDFARRDVQPGAEIHEPAGVRGEVLLLVSGVVGEARVLGDGRRQILALRLPGDALTPNPGETLMALTRARIVSAARLTTCLLDPSKEFQGLRRAWAMAGRTDQALLRDQVVRLGRMSAIERMAHMLLEAHERLAQVGLATGTTFHLPLTQGMISDVIGLSVVHLNRTLQTLRRSQLVASRQGYMTLVDRARLVDIAGYVSRFPSAWQPSENPAAHRPAQPGMAVAL